MPQSPDSVLKDLQSNKYAPIYFLQGEETFYIDRISDWIENNALDASARSFNQVILYGKDTDMAGILTNARRFPMMSDRQVVIVKEAQDIQDLGKESGASLLDNYLRNPLPSTILVFCHKHKSIDGKKKIAKALDEFAVLVNSKKLYDNQVPDWIANYIKTKGYSINPKATALLAESIGNDLNRIANETNKLLLNLKAGTEIIPDHIHQYVGISREYNVFELQKALMNRDVMKANKIINYFEADPKSNPIIPIITLLFGFFSKVLAAHTTSDKSDKGLAALLKINPYFVKDYQVAMRSYNIMKTMEIIHYLRIADLKSKGVESGSATEGQILKELIFKIMH
jgi:DNA polymerase III subunit delta